MLLLAFFAMVNANTSLQLPNPLTPMAFLPPDLARQVTISSYVLVGSSSVCYRHVVGILRAFALIYVFSIGINLGHHWKSQDGLEDGEALSY